MTWSIPLLAALAGACTPSDPPPTDEPAPGGQDSVATDTAPPPDSGAETVPPVIYDQVAVLLLDVGGQPVTTTDKVDGTLQVIRDHDGTLTDLDTAPRDWEGPVGVELHGSSSSGYPKANYRIELRDETGEDADYALLDLPAESDWVLHGPYCDKTLIRNALAFDLARALAEGSGRWEPRTAWTEVFLDGDYRGVYLLVERVKRGRDRLDVESPAASAAEGDVTGGYIVKIDQSRNEGWITANGTPVDYHYPRSDAITAEQGAYLRAWFDAFEAMLASDTWADRETGWPAWVDGDSFVDHYIVNELSHNIDAYRLSAYLYKDREPGLLFAGPVWDFDRAWGDVDYCDCQYVEGFTIDSLTTCGYGYQYPPWWSRLLQDPAFTHRLRCRWEELRQDLLSDGALVTTIQALTEDISAVEPRDHERWPVIGVDVDPNYYVGETYEDEVTWLVEWVLGRAAWLDAEMPGECD